MFRQMKLAAALVAAIALTGCDDDNSLAPRSTALVRVVHASPDAPNVDVLVDGAAVLTNVPFRAASDYLALPTGSRNLRVRASGTWTVVIGQNASVAAG